MVRKIIDDCVGYFSLKNTYSGRVQRARRVQKSTSKILNIIDESLNLTNTNRLLLNLALEGISSKDFKKSDLLTTKGGFHIYCSENISFVENLAGDIMSIKVGLSNKDLVKLFLKYYNEGELGINAVLKKQKNHIIFDL